MHQPQADPRVRDTSAADHAVDLLLASCGDERIALDPVTRRNRYNTSASVGYPPDILFSSATASSISSTAHGAATRAWQALQSGRPLTSWFDTLRERIARTYAFEGCEVVLCGSGTEAELLTLALAGAVLDRPLTNIVVAPEETGRGVVLAARGVHFLGSTAFAGTVAQGAALQDWNASEITLARVDIRGADGCLRTPDASEHEIVGHVDAAVAAGHGVLLHVLDHSKTGATAPRRPFARSLSQANSECMMVVVDACQLRCSPETVRDDLRAGCIVMITGSKFAAGPPFCGALLLPPWLAAALAGRRIPRSLDAYCAALDWPASLRHLLGDDAFVEANICLGLRWEAALAHIEAFLAIEPVRRARILTYFARAVRDRIAADDRLHMVEDSASISNDAVQTIFSIVTDDGETDATRRVYEALANVDATSTRSGASRVCLVGQPVPVGPRTALRVCASMPMVVAVATRMGGHRTLAAAFAPVADDLDILFAKWRLVKSTAAERSDVLPPFLSVSESAA